MKALRRIFGTAALILGLGSCIIVEDEHCREGAMSCDGTVIEECVYDEWEVIEGMKRTISAAAVQERD